MIWSTFYKSLDAIYIVKIAFDVSTLDKIPTVYGVVTNKI